MGLFRNQPIREIEKQNQIDSTRGFDSFIFLQTTFNSFQLHTAPIKWGDIHYGNPLWASNNPSIQLSKSLLCRAPNNFHKLRKSSFTIRSKSTTECLLAFPEQHHNPIDKPWRIMLGSSPHRSRRKTDFFLSLVYLFRWLFQVSCLGRSLSFIPPSFLASSLAHSHLEDCRPRWTCLSSPCRR